MGRQVPEAAIHGTLDAFRQTECHILYFIEVPFISHSTRRTAIFTVHNKIISPFILSFCYFVYLYGITCEFLHCLQSNFLIKYSLYYWYISFYTSQEFNNTKIRLSFLFFTKPQHIAHIKLTMSTLSGCIPKTEQLAHLISR